MSASQVIQEMLLEKIRGHEAQIAEYESLIDEEQREILQVREQLVNLKAIVEGAVLDPTPLKVEEPLGSSWVEEEETSVPSSVLPHFKDRLISVMGDRELTDRGILEALKAKDWLPRTDDPIQYINYFLNKEKDLFEKGRRGAYKVRNIEPTRDLDRKEYNVDELAATML